MTDIEKPEPDMNDLESCLNECLTQDGQQSRQEQELPPHAALYKLKSTYSNQEQRRISLLKEQKERRNKLVDKFRNLDPVSDEEEEVPVSKFIPRTYKNKLMLSEWLVEIPKDLNENWITVLCPIGKRTLVVAADGKTQSFSRSGFRIASFPSLLPGGCRNYLRKSSDSCMLDCIFSAVDKVYYVLDILQWKSQPLLDTQADFRFYWLNTKLNELGQDLQTHGSLNPFKFVPLFQYSYSDLKTVITSPPPYPMDGVLFFHRESFYKSGRSPLVGWLKPFMLPRHLDIPVSDQYTAELPQGYVDVRTYVLSTQKTRKKKDKSTKMEMGDNCDDEIDDVIIDD